jgi:tRNA A37 threonylcarbamoyladenosine dehydratase
VIDAIDQVRAKAALIAHCRRAGIRIVTTGGAGGRTDPTRIEVPTCRAPPRMRWPPG